MRLRVSISVLATVLAAAGLATGCSEKPLFGSESYTGYFAPVYSPDGRYIYYVVRDTRGRINGPGMEFFTPPAEVRVDADLFRIHRIDLRTGRDQTVASLPDSPLVRREIETYRSRIFTCPSVTLRFAGNGNLEYEVAVVVPTRPTSTTWRIWRKWNDESQEFEGPDVWIPSHMQGTALLEYSVLDEREILALAGPECYPSAIVTLDHRARKFEVLLASADFEEEYPDGLTTELVFAESKREEIDRLRRMRVAHAEAIERFRAEGLPEGEALMRANREMQKLGFYPASPTMIARPVDRLRSDVPLFEISDTEVELGLFPDIDAAIASPGTRVDKMLGHYVRHRDFETTERLNAWLDTGAKVFLVRMRGRAWEISIDRER